MSMRRWIWAGLAALAMTGGPASAQPALEDHLLAQLSCLHPPGPVPALVALDRDGLLDHAQALRMDSATCWPLASPLLVAGMAFGHVCASAEDPLLVELFPDYFWRGPGTSAGTGLAMLTAEPVAAVADWARQSLADGGRVRIDESWQMAGLTELSCNSSAFLD